MLTGPRPDSPLVASPPGFSALNKVLAPAFYEKDTLTGLPTGRVFDEQGNALSVVTATTDAVTGNSDFSFHDQRTIPSTHYWLHAYAPVQGNKDAKFYDQSGAGNDGTRGTNLSLAQLWATAGFASTVDPAGGTADSVLHFPVLGYDYAGGESLIICWKGQITPEGASVSFLGDALNSGEKGFCLRVDTTGCCSAVLSNGAGTTKFPTPSTVASFVASETHSFVCVIDGSLRKITWAVDGAINVVPTTLADGGSVDTVTTKTINLGTGSALFATTGIATKTQALAIFRLPPTKSVPSNIAEIADAFHRNPSALINAGML